MVYLVLFAFKSKIMFLYFKFGCEKDMLDLLQNGTIYCNPLSYFAREDKSGRFDTDELVVHIKTQFDGKTTLYNEQGVKMKIHSSQTKDVILDPIGNLYCVYSLNIENVPLNSYHAFHRKMTEFGSHVVIIKDSAQFMRRLTTKLNELKIINNKGFIKYVEMRDFQGDKDLFTKDVAFKHQKEFRIHLGTGSVDPYHFSIGSIETIAALEEVENIKELSIRNDELLLHLKRPSKYDSI